MSMTITSRSVILVAVFFASAAFALSAFADQNQDQNQNGQGQDKPNVAVCPRGGKTDDAIHCNAHVVTDRTGTPTTTTLPAGYGPAQFHAAYTSQTKASGKKILAIVDAYDDPYIQNDLNTYSQMFGIANLPKCSGSIANSAMPCFQKINQRGGSSAPAGNASWALETSLDVETAHAMCQNCSILLVEADSASYANLMAAVDQAVAKGASVVSNSYGSEEFSGETSYDSHFNHPGVAFTFSSGDSGYGVEYPAASQYVTAVGGTSLSLNGLSYIGESAWSGAGSGCSAYENKPSWQKDTGCTKRTVADVSADADPSTGAAVYDSYRYAGQRGWFQVGGTSLASPVVASVYALSDNTADAANSLPYANASALHDVTAGFNGSCGGTYLCTAITGFDGPTGLGTPNGVLAF